MKNILNSVYGVVVNWYIKLYNFSSLKLDKCARRLSKIKRNFSVIFLLL